MIDLTLSSVNPFAASKPSLKIRKIEEIDIQVGSSNFFIDGIRNLLSLLPKLLLLNNNFNSGNVSKEITDKTREYLHDNNLHDVNVSMNQYKPQEVWHRTFTNPKTSLLSKCTAGLASCLIETLAFPKLSGFPGDHFNPLSNTVHLFSNDLAIALHECGHAKDLNGRKNPTLYVCSRNLPLIGPFITVYQEFTASSNAINYLRAKRLNEQVKLAFKVLIPAFASYCACAILPAPSFEIESLKQYSIGFVTIVALGHILGEVMANQEQESSEPVLPKPVFSPA